MSDHLDMVKFYAKDNVFYPLEETRWPTTQAQSKQDAPRVFLANMLTRLKRAEHREARFTGTMVTTRRID